MASPRPEPDSRRGGWCRAHVEALEDVGQVLRRRCRHRRPRRPRRSTPASAGDRHPHPAGRVRGTRCRPGSRRPGPAGRGRRPRAPALGRRRRSSATPVRSRCRPEPLDRRGHDPDPRRPGAGRGGTDGRRGGPGRAGRPPAVRGAAPRDRMTPAAAHRVRPVPSPMASAYPRIEVSGVRRSWDTDSRNCCSSPRDRSRPSAIVLIERVRSLSSSPGPVAGRGQPGAQVAGGDPVRWPPRPRRRRSVSARLSRTATTAPATRVSAAESTNHRNARPGARSTDRVRTATSAPAAHRSGGQRVDGAAVVAAQGLAGEQPVRVEVRRRRPPAGAWPGTRPCRSRNTKSMPSSSKARSTRASAGRRTPACRSTVGAVSVGQALGLVAELRLGRGPGPEAVEHERAQAGEHQGGERPMPRMATVMRARMFVRARSAEPVADAPHGGEREPVAELLAELARRGRRPCARRPPSRAPHTLSRSWRRLSATPAVVGQVLEEVELAGGQGDGRARRPAPRGGRGPPRRPGDHDVGA